jgi:hypothetical protein
MYTKFDRMWEKLSDFAPSQDKMIQHSKASTHAKDPLIAVIHTNHWFVTKPRNGEILEAGCRLAD